MSITLPLGLRRDRGDREDQWLLTQPVNQAVIGCELRWPMRPMIFHDLPIFIMVMMVMFHGGLLMIVELWESIWLLSCKETAVHQWVFNTFGFPTSLMVTRNINTLPQNTSNTHPRPTSIYPDLKISGMDNEKKLFESFKHFWFVVWNICFLYLGNVITPTDELIFFRGVGLPPSRLWT